MKYQLYFSKRRDYTVTNYIKTVDSYNKVDFLLIESYSLRISWSCALFHWVSSPLLAQWHSKVASFTNYRVVVATAQEKRYGESYTGS